MLSTIIARRLGKLVGCKHISHTDIVVGFTVIGLAAIALAWFYHYEWAHDVAEFSLVPLIEHVLETEA